MKNLNIIFSCDKVRYNINNTVPFFIGDKMNNIFYDFNKMISYNALLNFIIGERGVGKSYGAKKFVAKRFINKNKQFVYLRRYKTELKESMYKNKLPIFWEQITTSKNDPEMQDLIKTHKFTNTKDTMLIDNKVCGYAIPLSIANIFKSSTYDNVNTIIFDEFIIDKGSYHYLQNEVIQLLDVIETVARLRDIRVIFLGNAISITNPYFTFFDLSLPYNSEFKIAKRDNKGNPLILINYIKNENYRKVKKESRFGQLISNTEYGKYAIDNEFLRDSKSFIKKKTNISKFYFILVINNNYYGVWCDYKIGYMFISKDYDPNCPVKFSIQPDDHNENTLLIRTRTSPFFKSIIEHYRLARLCFENQQIKNNVMQHLIKFLTF